MNTSAVSAVALRDFLEQDLNLGRPVESESLVTIFDAAKKPLHYSGFSGMLTASINTTTSDQWMKIHSTEEPTTVLYNALLEPTLRIEAFIKHQLARYGLVMADNFSPQAVNVRTFVDAVRRFSDHYAQLNPKKQPLEILSSITLRKVEDEPNWDAVLRVGMFEKEGDVLYAQFRIPQMVSGVARMVTLEQANAITKSSMQFLKSFGEVGLAFRPLQYNDMPSLITQLVIQQPDISAEQVYRIFYDMVRANRELYLLKEEKDQLTLIVSWETLPVIRRQMLSALLEVARIKAGMYLVYNKEQAMAV